MFTATDAILTAAGFLGFSAAGLTAAPPELESTASVVETEPQPSPDLLSPGELYFESVASELREHGFLND